jgi:hypothetical protein
VDVFGVEGGEEDFGHRLVEERVTWGRLRIKAAGE